MSIYLNPKNLNFKEALAAPIYVDKTMMIGQINRFMDVGNKFICISRPRRFGKTMAGNMLAAYYSKGCDSRQLLMPYKIARDPSFGEKLNKYNVIQVDVNSEYQNTNDRIHLVERLSRKIKREISEAFPSCMITDDMSLAESLIEVYDKTGETFILLFDEYDVLVREQVDAELFNKYLSFLNGLFKSNTVRPAISLAYLTGILPVVRDKIQSKLNNFEEYTMLDAGELAEFVGFISEEVEDMCDKYGASYEELRRWYDGYSQHGYEIYNPESLVKAVSKGYCSNYWGKTSSYRAISDRIEGNYKGIKDDIVRLIAGESIRVNVTRYMNTMDSFKTREDVFTYLIHIGYLAYDLKNGSCRIPNGEIREEWYNVLEDDEKYSVTDRIIKASESLLSDTIRGDSDSVARALDESHIHVTSNRSYNNEYALQSAIYLAYIYALNKYNIVREMTSGKGYADVTFLPYKKDDPAMVIELKHNKSAGSALAQIKRKKYFDSISGYHGRIILVGINYDEKQKTHSCKIDEIFKE